MRFITFQPNDYKTSIRYKGYKDIYYNELGYNPIWCIQAENLESAVFNTLLTYPITPENVIFFKTNDFFAIDKINHYKYLISKNNKTYSRAILMRKATIIDELYNRGIEKTKAINFITNKMPYFFEYLVNPNDIKIVKEINISDIINREFVDKKQQLDEIIKIKTNKAIETYDKESEGIKDWYTLDRHIRNKISYYKWQLYTLDNDFFIKDYEKVFGTKNEDENISVEQINIPLFEKYIYELNCNPSKEIFNKIIEYLTKTCFI